MLSENIFTSNNYYFMYTNFRFHNIKSSNFLPSLEVSSQQYEMSVFPCSATVRDEAAA